MWDKTGITAIELEGEEAGISSASVVEIDGVHHMWFSCRHAYEFRTTEIGRIKLSTPPQKMVIIGQEIMSLV